MKKPEPSISTRVARWIGLLLVYGVLASIPAMYLFSLYPDMPWWKAALGGLVVLVGGIAYLIGPEIVYKRFCEPLGYRCEVKPDKKPASAGDEVGMVITGKFEGQAFTLYSEKNLKSRTAPTRWTTLEWSGADIALPEFKLQVNPGPSVGSDSSGTKLAARSKVSAPDPVAVQKLFTKALWEALDPLIAWGSLEASPGLLVIRQFPIASAGQQGRFPLPWEIESFLSQSSEIRRLLCPRKALG